MSETLDTSLDVGVEESELAETTEDVETEAEVVEEGEEEQEVTEPAFDKNAIAAAARREAEAELKKRDAEYARRFANYTNPVTGKPIQSERDYFEALDAQETIRRNQELRDKGVDPAIIDQAIANNPMVRQAEMVLEQTRQEQLQRGIEEEIRQINALDPTIKSFTDLENCPNRDALLEMVQKGYSLYDAYRLANYDQLMSRKSAAAEQKAINQAKGKSHLTPTSSGSSQNDGLEDIPVSQLDKWRAFFPDASEKELKEKYNRAKR